MAAGRSTSRRPDPAISPSSIRLLFTRRCSDSRLEHWDTSGDIGSASAAAVPWLLLATGDSMKSASVSKFRRNVVRHRIAASWPGLDPHEPAPGGRRRGNRLIALVCSPGRLRALKPPKGVRVWGDGSPSTGKLDTP